MTNLTLKKNRFCKVVKQTPQAKILRNWDIVLAVDGKITIEEHELDSTVSTVENLGV